MTDTPAQQLIYGCMGLGGGWDPETPYTDKDVTAAQHVVTAALEVGITAFDHADIYRAGKAEAVFGVLLREDPTLRGRILIQTKCGIRVGEGGLAVHYDLRGSSISDRVHASIERLGVDAVDTLLLHRPDPLAHPEGIGNAVMALHAEGVIRQVGVSNMSATQMATLKRYLEIPLVANQLELSLAKRDWVEAEIGVNGNQPIDNDFPLGTLEYCREAGVAVQSWGALARGIYSGATRPDRSAAESATAALVIELARKYHATPEAVVLGWLMKHPAAISPVIGTTDPARIRACSNARAVGQAMAYDDWYRLFVTARGRDLP